jgi:hypothetical protein
MGATEDTARRRYAAARRAPYPSGGVLDSDRVRSYVLALAWVLIGAALYAFGILSRAAELVG